MNKLIKILLVIAGISLVLNLVWENLQAPLYQGYSSFWQHLPVCSVASLGDVLIILISYFVLAIVNKDMLWITKMSRADVAILIVTGALVAIGIEKWALATGRWQYDSAMPLIPYVEVGFLPVIQMILLPLLTYYISKRIAPMLT